MTRITEFVVPIDRMCMSKVSTAPLSILATGSELTVLHFETDKMCDEAETGSCILSYSRVYRYKCTVTLFNIHVTVYV